MATSNEVSSRLMKIPDHLLMEIFLRLPAPEDLARASAACVSFRRLVTDRSFLRSFRRLHAPPLLGFLDHDGFNPALPPHPSAPAARALAHAADFSFSFLPSRCRWAIRDIRDNLVLLVDPQHDEWAPVFREVAVCDPLHRRYVLLPPLPQDLAASVEHFLAPLGQEPETAFRVICVAHFSTRVVAFVFPSNTGQWQTAASKNYSDGIGRSEATTMRMAASIRRLRCHYANGCFYWDTARFGNLVEEEKRLLVLDTQRMEFSMTDLPPGNWGRADLAIVGAGEGRIGIFGFDRGTPSVLSYAVARTKGKSPSQWQIEKRISLDPRYDYRIEDATERYLLLTRTKSSAPTGYFSIDSKTFKLQSVCEKQRMRLVPNSETRIYTNFPPSLLSSRAV
ncbi:uncharacterized protein LOC124662736 [Lolium rigidum]|uniref:uncharacterized protein LOC124662736 n=1 Tax=Lolium rigidum TaxID=89674 RepID=UPI001F5D7409|nr:uncharacterized protein LOC124662736 [Lolium rigidum]